MNKSGELELEIVLVYSVGTGTRMDQTSTKNSKAGSSLLGVSQAREAHPQGVLSFLLNMGSVTEAC